MSQTTRAPRSSTWLWILVSCAVLTQSGLNLFRPITSYKLLGLGADPVVIGLTTAAYALLPLVSAVWLGRMSDRIPQLRLLILSGVGLLALAGIIVESLVRDPAWAFADAGKRVERAQQTIRLLRSVIAVERTPVVEGSTTEAALIATESVITFRRRLASGLGSLSSLQAALDLILGDLSNPRSVAFQVERLVEALSVIGDETALAQARSTL